ncbi:MAG: hypothetical protein P8074_06500 [Anaerolineales bacterium]
MTGMERVWQAAGTVQAVLKSGLLENAFEAGMRSLFIGFETLNPNNLQEQNKYHNLNHNYNLAIRRLHDPGAMVNGSFVFGMDHDDQNVFDHTVAWAVEHGIETATFHILTPYPGTALYERMSTAGRITSHDWNLYDTRHVVYRPTNMTLETLQAGYWRAYREFYRWGSIIKGATKKSSIGGTLRHLAYAGGWKKFEFQESKRATDYPHLL